MEIRSGRYASGVYAKIISGLRTEDNVELLVVLRRTATSTATHNHHRVRTHQYCPVNTSKDVSPRQRCRRCGGRACPPAKGRHRELEKQQVLTAHTDATDTFKMGEASVTASNWRLVEVGRVALFAKGPFTGRLATIVQIIDHKRVR